MFACFLVFLWVFLFFFYGPFGVPELKCTYFTYKEILYSTVSVLLYHLQLLRLPNVKKSVIIHLHNYKHLISGRTFLRLCVLFLFYITLFYIMQCWALLLCYYYFCFFVFFVLFFQFQPVTVCVILIDLSCSY